MDTQIELTLGQTLQLFYKFGLTALPVVNDRSELIGTFEKSDAVSLGTLRSRLDEKLAPHLQKFMLPAGPAIEARLKRLMFEKSRTIPVLTRDGKLSHYWHMGDELLDNDLPMPYRLLLMALVDGIQRPVAVVFQEPRAGESASAAFLRRLGLSRERLRPWFDEMHWQGGAQDQGIAFLKDAEELSVLLIRTPLRIRDQHYGWILETKEEYEIAVDVTLRSTQKSAEGGRAPAKEGTLRKKIGAQGIRRVVNAFEQFLLKKGMARSQGDVRRLPGLLGLSRQSLRYKLKKHKLSK